MRKTLCALGAAILMLASCSTSYSIKGTSDVQNLDGNMLYLKASVADEVKNLDSCDVVHGQFSFSGNIDTVKVAALYLDDESIMPIVLEEGDITIKFDNAKQTCTGTPLNDKLAKFIEKYNQITNQIVDLQHQHDQAIMNGDNMEVVINRLQQKSNALNQQYDDCITSFIEENFDNILGPFVFQMATSNMEIPLTNAWIDALMAKATDAFKENKYVKDFMNAAEHNQAIMTGMEEPAPQMPAAPPAGGPEGGQAAPTPNELAQPEK